MALQLTPGTGQPRQRRSWLTRQRPPQVEPPRGSTTAERITSAQQRIAEAMDRIAAARARIAAIKTGVVGGRQTSAPQVAHAVVSTAAVESQDAARALHESVLIAADRQGRLRRAAVAASSARDEWLFALSSREQLGREMAAQRQGRWDEYRDAEERDQAITEAQARERATLRERGDDARWTDEEREAEERDRAENEAAAAERADAATRRRRMQQARATWTDEHRAAEERDWAKTERAALARAEAANKELFEMMREVVTADDPALIIGLYDMAADANQVAGLAGIEAKEMVAPDVGPDDAPTLQQWSLRHQHEVETQRKLMDSDLAVPNLDMIEQMAGLLGLTPERVVEDERQPSVTTYPEPDLFLGPLEPPPKPVQEPDRPAPAPAEAEVPTDLAGWLDMRQQRQGWVLDAVTAAEKLRAEALRVATPEEATAALEKADVGREIADAAAGIAPEEAPERSWRRDYGKYLEQALGTAPAAPWGWSIGEAVRRMWEQRGTAPEASAEAGSPPSAEAGTAPEPAPEPAAEPAAEPEPSQYTVQPGDTLSAIAQRFGTTVESLAKVNNIDDPDLIRPGQQLSLSGTAQEGWVPRAARALFDLLPAPIQGWLTSVRDSPLVQRFFANRFEGKPTDMSTPRGMRNNNPGNIRHGASKWDGMAEQQLDSAFVGFKLPEYGIQASAELFNSYENYYGWQSLGQKITYWAPPQVWDAKTQSWVQENDTGSYIKSVARTMGVELPANYEPRFQLLPVGAEPGDYPDRITRTMRGPANRRWQLVNDETPEVSSRDADTMQEFLQAVYLHENGQQPYSDEQFLVGMAMARRGRQFPGLLESLPIYAEKRQMA